MTKGLYRLDGFTTKDIKRLIESDGWSEDQFYTYFDFANELPVFLVSPVDVFVKGEEWFRYSTGSKPTRDEYTERGWRLRQLIDSKRG